MYHVGVHIPDLDDADMKKDVFASMSTSGYVALVQGFVGGLSKEQRIQLGVKTFDRLFKETPEAIKL